MKQIAVLAALAACGKSSSPAPSDPPPPKPANGAPVAMLGGDIKPGSSHSGSVHVKAYNFSDQRVAQYSVLFRYHDAAGAVLKVQPGTPFEADFDHTGLGGPKYACDPKAWCSFTVDGLNVPDKTASVEVLANRVVAIKDGAFVDKPLFEAPFSWPN